MSRTTREDDGIHGNRERRYSAVKHLSTSKHPKGFDTFEDDHGLYGQKGSKMLKKAASRARRIFSKNVMKGEINDSEI